MRPDEAAQQLNQVASLLAQAAPPGWKRIFLGFETLDTEDQIGTSSICIAVVKPLFGKPQKKDLQVPPNVRELMKEVALHFMQRAKQNYVTLDLLLFDGGKFKSYIDYEPLQRLGPEVHSGKRYHKYAGDDPLLKDL
jgi:hypothetical protein